MSNIDELMRFQSSDLVFSGHSLLTIDEQGRVAIAKSFRKAMPVESGGKLKICLGQARTIEIHPLSEWKRFELPAISPLDKDVEEEREKLEAKLWFSVDVEMDSAHRILIPEYMLKYAQLKPKAECALAGSGRFITLLSRAEFDMRMERYLQNYSRVAGKKRSASGALPSSEVLESKNTGGGKVQE